MADVVIDLASLTPEQGFTVQGDAVVDSDSGTRRGFGLGFSVSEAGDVNGDGFADFIVGAPGSGDGYGSGLNNGRAYVIYGKAGGTRPDIDLANLSPTDGFAILGDGYGYGNAGFSVAGADINGDGISDLIVSSPLRGASEISYDGTIYVIYGIRSPTRANVDLGSLAPGQGFLITGEGEFDRAGYSVAAAGDFNGDGVGDILIGAPGSDYGSSNAGSAYLIFGQRGTARANIDLGALLATDGFALHYDSDGGYDGSRAGFSVSGGSDVNGDGFADIIIGAPYQRVSDDAPINGQAFVIFGQPGATHPDVDLLGFTNGFSTYSETNPRLGFSVSFSDLNGDGFAEAVIGWPDYQLGGQAFGAAEVSFYQVGGPGYALSFHGELAGDQAGFSVSGAGDINGDGFGDLLIATPFATDSDGYRVGRTYVIYGKGSATQIGVDLASLAADEGFVVESRGYDRAGWSVSAAGDINGDGFGDLIVGAPYNGTSGFHAGAAYVIYGFASAPNDTNWIFENGAPVTGNVLQTIAHNGAPDNKNRGDVGDLPFTLGNPYLELRDDSDNVLRSDDDSGGGLKALIEEYTAPYNGTYFLAASGAGNTTGSYRVSAVKVADAPDDFAGNASTAGTVTPGSATVGTIEVTSDTDWFRVALTPGKFYRFDAKGADTGNGTQSDPVLELRDANGNVLARDDDSGVGLNSEIWGFSPPAVSGGGTFYLAVSGFSGSKGTYTVSATEIPADDFAGDTATGGTVAVGGSRTGNVQFAGDSDWFTIFLEGGATYQLDLRGNDSSAGAPGGTLVDPLIEVRDSDGNLIASDNDSGAGLNARITSFVAPSSGRYHVTAQASGPGTGTYTVDATLIDDYAGSQLTSGFVSPSFTAAGKIETAGDQDWFSVFLDKGATYRFDLTGGAGAPTLLANPLLELRDVNGNIVASDDDSGPGLNAQIGAYTAPTTGLYYLTARSSTTAAAGTGSYQLSEVLVDDHGQTPGTAGSIAVGETRSGTIEAASDQDWFTVTLTAGQKYTFDLLGSATANGTLANPLLELRDSAGVVITTDDDSGTGANARIADFIAPSSGTFILSALAGPVPAGGTGTYQISVTGSDDFSATTATTGTVSIGGSSTGNIERAGDSDWFAVNLTKGTKYVFDAKGSATGDGTLSDPTLEVRDASGALLVSDDDDGFGLNSQYWGFVAPTTGTYFLAAGGYGSATGTYTVSAAVTDPDDFAGSMATTGNVAVGGRKTGAIETIGDSDWFEVNLEEGATYNFALEGSPGDPTVTNPGTFDLEFGRLTLNADGSYSYALYTKAENPAAWQTVHDLGSSDAPLAESFAYGYLLGSAPRSATLTISIFGVDNNAPVAVDDAIATDEDTAVAINVLANDSDPDGDAIVVTGSPRISQGLGTVSVVNDRLVYDPSPAYNSLPLGTNATVVIDYTIADPSGDTANAKAVVTVTGVNDRAVIGGAKAGSVTEDASAILTTKGALTVADPDTGEASFQVQAATKGVYGSFTLAVDGAWSYAADNSQSAIQALGAGKTATDSFQVKSFDGTTDTVTITINGVNDAPVVPPSKSVTTEQNKVSGSVTIGATDVDGDALVYSAAIGPAHGAVSLNQANGSFAFTPAAGFVGFDSFTLLVSDGNGGSGTMAVDVTVFPPQPGAPLIDSPVPRGGSLNPAPGSAAEADGPPVADPRFRLVAVDGFAGSVAGSGDVFGSNGFQDVSVLAGSGSVTLDGSFARGGDVVRLAGVAAGYTIAVAGSNAVLSHGAETVTIPLGTAGLALVFGDGARWLGFDAAAGSARIGAQAFGTGAAQITAAADGTALPSGADPAATARLVLAEQGEVSVSGNVAVFGSNGAERLHLLGGSATLDGSFARGGDTLFLTGKADAYSAYLAGSSLILTGAGTSLSVPVGTAGLDLDFAGDDRTLRFDLASASVVIGDQTIAATSLATAQHLDAFAFA